MSKKRAKNSAGLLDYKVHVSQFHEKYYLEPSQSDVILVIEGQKLPAHRLIISAESEFFKALLYGRYAEKDKKEIEIQDVSYQAFLLILQYMYSKVIDLTDEDLDVVLKASELTQRFGLDQLEKGFEEYLISILSVENILKIFPMANLLDTKKLLDKVWSLIEKNEEKVLELDDFISLKSADVCGILTRERKKVSEVQVFERINDWVEKNPGTTDILNCLDFNRLTWSQIIQVVQPTQLYEDSYLFNVLRSKGFGIKAITNCENPESVQSTGAEFAAAKKLLINGKAAYAFIVELDTSNLIDHIQMKVDEDDVLGYKIEISKDKDKWTQVLDYPDFFCREEQDLYFPRIETNFIRISSTDAEFKINSLKVYYSSQLPKMIEGFICPKRNVDINGRVCENYSWKGQLKMIWCKFEANGLDTTYISDPTILLNQPYYVNTIRFRLWDYDGRKQAYKLSIEAKSEQPAIVLKDSDEEVDGWQLMKFPATFVTDIAIVGKEPNGEKVRVAFFEVFYDETL